MDRRNVLGLSAITALGLALLSVVLAIEIACNIEPGAHSERQKEDSDGSGHSPRKG